MTDPTTATAQIDATLAALPADQRAALQTLRQTIATVAPEATETISYGMPAFRYHGRALVSYAAFKAHCSFFPMSSTLIQAHHDELAGIRHGQGHAPVHARAPSPRRRRDLDRARAHDPDRRTLRNEALVPSSAFGQAGTSPCSSSCCGRRRRIAYTATRTIAAPIHCVVSRRSPRKAKPPATPKMGSGRTRWPPRRPGRRAGRRGRPVRYAVVDDPRSDRARPGRRR